MLRLAGENGVAAITILLYSQFLFNALFLGFSMGVAPVISYNYGAKNTGGLKSVCKICRRFVIVSSIIIDVYKRQILIFYILKLKIFIIFRCKTMIDQMAALIRDAVTVIIRHPILKVNQIIKFPVCRPFYMYMIRISVKLL